MDNEKNTRTGNERAAEIELLRYQTPLVEAQTQLEKVRAASRTTLIATIGVLLAILFGLGFVLLMARG